MGCVFNAVSSAAKTVWSGIKNVAERAWNTVTYVTSSAFRETYNVVQQTKNLITTKINGFKVKLTSVISLVAGTIIGGILQSFSLGLFAVAVFFISVYILSKIIFGRNNQQKDTPVVPEPKPVDPNPIPVIPSGPNFDKEIKKKTFDHTDIFLMDVNSYINNPDIDYDINPRKKYNYTFDQNGKGISKNDKNIDDDIDDMDVSIDIDNSDDDIDNKEDKNDKDNKDNKDDNNNINDKDDKNDMQDNQDKDDDKDNIHDKDNNNLQDNQDKDDNKDNIHDKDNNNNLQDNQYKDDNKDNIHDKDNNNNLQDNQDKDKKDVVDNKDNKDVINNKDIIDNELGENEYVKNNVMTSFVIMEKAGLLYYLQFNNSISNLESGKKILKNIENRLKDSFEDDYKVAYLVQNENGDNEEKAKLEDMKIENVEDIELIQIVINKKIY